MNPINRSIKPAPGRLRLLSLALAAGLFAAGVASAAPPAGTVIGNQAAATYTDASAVSRTATSNTVTTVVQQVGAFTLTAAQTKIASPGAPISFAHTFTNTGNGNDSFTLAAVNNSGDNFDLTGLAIYADATCDGVADNATAITSIGPVSTAGTACVVVTGTVPGSATTGQLSFTVLYPAVASRPPGSTSAGSSCGCRYQTCASCCRLIFLSVPAARTSPPANSRSAKSYQ